MCNLYPIRGVMAVLVNMCVLNIIKYEVEKWKNKVNAQTHSCTHVCLYVCISIKRLCYVTDFCNYITGAKQNVNNSAESRA